MLYKTIILELLQDQYPKLHERLRASRTLLSTLDQQATALKRYHEDWMDELSTGEAGQRSGQIASEALELAIERPAGQICPPSRSRPTPRRPFPSTRRWRTSANHTPLA